MKLVEKAFLLKQRASAPVSITATSGTPQSANCGAAYTNPLVATITPAISGVSVTFTAPASGASGTFASTSTRTETVLTNGSGVATSSAFTAGPIGQEGAYNVVATTGALSCNFALTNTVLYILDDEFTTAASAPLTSPRTCEPGPGTLTLVDTGNKASIAGGYYVANTGTTRYVDPRFYTPSANLTRAAGLLLQAVVQGHTNPEILVGFGPTNVGTTYESGLYAAGSDLYVNSSAGLALLQAGGFALDTDITFSIVLRTTGAQYFVKGGANYPNQTLVWQETTGNTAALFAKASFSLVNLKYVNRFTVRQLPAPFNTDFGLTSVNVASPTNLALQTATADQIVRLTVKAPATLTTECGLRYRILDANNYWRTYFKTDGSFNVDSVNAGTPTSRIAVAGAILGNQTVTITVVTHSTFHDAYTDQTKRGTQVNVSWQDTQTSIAAEVGAGWTVTNLRSSPYTSAVYSTELDKL